MSIQTKNKKHVYFTKNEVDFSSFFFSKMLEIHIYCMQNGRSLMAMS